MRSIDKVKLLSHLTKSGFIERNYEDDAVLDMMTTKTPYWSYENEARILYGEYPISNDSVNDEKGRLFKEDEVGVKLVGLMRHPSQKKHTESYEKLLSIIRKKRKDILDIQLTNYPIIKFEICKNEMRKTYVNGVRIFNISDSDGGRRGGYLGVNHYLERKHEMHLIEAKKQAETILKQPRTNEL